MPTCEMCLRDYTIEDDLQPDDCCDECAAFNEYWLSLTPEQQRDEELMMARYATEGDGL